MGDRLATIDMGRKVWGRGWAAVPNFSGRRLNIYHSPTHGVALVRI